MKFCKDCGISFATFDVGEYTMICDYNDEPCQRRISEKQNCNNPSKFTVITKPDSTQHFTADGRIK
jgi:hypothetical protein